VADVATAPTYVITVRVDMVTARTVISIVLSV
jgi:hypothetical protein